MKKISKRIISAVLAAAIAVSGGGQAFGFDTYYTQKSVGSVTKGVTLTESTLITDLGLLDIYVLRLPATDANISLAAVDSGMELGLKEPASKLLTDAGAIAGINGDFFGMSGNYSMPTGLQVNSDGVMSVSNDINSGQNKYSSFMLDSGGNYFMGYVDVGLAFLTDGVERLELASINKVSDLAGPTCITPDAMETTAEIDARIEGAVKLVVRNNIISYISLKGETVQVPPDGYVIMMNSALADAGLGYFYVGQRAELSISSSVNLNAIKAAISGGGKILSNGYIETNGSFYIKGSNPRTAIGLSRDGTEIILMVVDGRGDSIGVTHEELAQLMLEAGAYNAMHLDGGGSTEMLVQRMGDSSLTVVNNPSGGFERKIINALGVFMNAPEGEMKTLVIEPASDSFIKSVPLKVDVYAMDEYMRRIDIPEGLIKLSCSGGSFFDGYFNAYETGAYNLFASYNGFTSGCVITATELYELNPNPGRIDTQAGGQTELSFTGIGGTGNTFYIDSLSVGYEVYPSGLGHVENGVFHAEALGTGWLRCFVGNVDAYIPIYSTIHLQTIDTLTGGVPAAFSGYPENVAGTAGYVYTPYYTRPVLGLTYTFGQSGQTQAAYVDFTGFSGLQAQGFALSVFGDLSGHWLRGSVLDAEGNRFLIDFEKSVSWEGWKEVEAWLPAEAVLPVTLEKIYAASLSNDFETTQTLYFTNLRGLYNYSAQYPEVSLPESDKFSDPYMVSLHEGAEYGYDISVLANLGSVKGSERDAAVGAFQYNSSFGICLGGVPDGTGVPTDSLNGTFASNGVGDVLLVKMAAKNGGFMSTDVNQWAEIRQTISQSYTNNIIIAVDYNPRRFSNQKEFIIFHDMLREFVKAGKKIFVVSGGGAEPGVTVMDGVRYINLCDLYDGTGVLNDNFSILRFRVSGNDIRYSMEKVLP